jgi:hypothetical protein
MKKISTYFKKDPDNLGRVVNEINPENAWAQSAGIATRKWDGTSVAILSGELYKRYDVKAEREVPAGAIECQDPDPISGHHPHWLKCDRNDSADKYHFEAFDRLNTQLDGTYELIGPKINGNREKQTEHTMRPHGADEIDINDRSFEGIKKFLSENDIEGIVFHADDETGRMCKIRKKDFGIKR